MSAAGLNALKKYEGCRLEPYLDEAGVLTIGYGHTRDVAAWAAAGRKLTQHEADVILMSDLEAYEDGVTYFLRNTEVTQSQFDALVSLCFNIGVTRFGQSTLMRKLLKGDVAGAAEQFDAWRFAGGRGHVSPGLVKRRAEEKAMFLEGFV